MNFKSIDFVVLAAALFLGLVACGSDSSSGPQENTVPVESSGSIDPSSSAVAEPQTSSEIAESSSDAALPKSSSSTINPFSSGLSYVFEGNGSSAASSASVAPDVEYGTLQDPRDGKSYKTVVIGGKTWMAENLNFSKSTDGSVSLDSTFCLNNILANCEKYGRFYQEFDAAKACPEGWAIPQASDWRDLTNAAKETYGDNNGSLRAVGEWEDTIFGDNVVATNASGFSALPAGYRASTGEYDGEGTKAYFWGEDNMNRYAWILSNQYDLDKESIMRGYFAYAIRCIKN